MNVVQKTAALFRYIYRQGFSLQKNVSYNSNEELKRDLRKVDDFFNGGLKKVAGITKLSRFEKNVIIQVCIDDYDDVLLIIYKSIKGLIGKSVEISIEKAYLVNVIYCIELQITDPEGNDLYYQRIPISKFAITDDYNKFKLYLSAEIQDSAPELYKWAEFLKSLEILFNSVTQINQGIGKVEECNINEIYRKRINDSYKKTFEELTTCFVQNITSNKEIIVQWIKSLEKFDFVTIDKETTEMWNRTLLYIQDIVCGKV